VRRKLCGEKRRTIGDEARVNVLKGKIGKLELQGFPVIKA
jgi:hypothetical protein